MEHKGKELTETELSEMVLIGITLKEKVQKDTTSAVLVQ